MNESELKRYLVRSIKAQGGVGHRIEDRYKVGWPDLILLPKPGPVFFAEAKMIKGAKLVCTPLQGVKLKELWRPPHAISVILGYRDDLLYIGCEGDKLADCLSLIRPARLDSPEWPITTLLHAFDKLEQYGITKHSDELEPT